MVLLCFSNMAKDMSKRVGYDSLELGCVALALHSVGLASAGLAIGENGAVVTLQYVLHNGSRSQVIDVNL